jgi:hypothetical protein
MPTKLLSHLSAADLAEFVRAANKGHGSNGVSGDEAVRRFAELIAEEVRTQVASAASAVIRDFQASGDTDLDDLVQQALRDLCKRLGVYLKA